MKITGTVIRKKVAGSSKSEHAALSMEVNGRTFILRQRGRNAFNNPELDELAGKQIAAEGELVSNIFFIRSYTIIP